MTAAQARREGLEDLDRVVPAERSGRPTSRSCKTARADRARRRTCATSPARCSSRASPATTTRATGGCGSCPAPATRTRVIAEMTLAHELDARARGPAGSTSPSRRAATTATLAKSAMIEGTATALMYAYVQRYFTSEETLGGLLGAAFEDTGGLPPFLEAQVVFPYVGGNAFVDRAAAAGRRAVGPREPGVRVAPAGVDRADPPSERLLRRRRAGAVRLRAAAVLGRGWERAAAGTWGELQTRELASAPARPPRAGAGIATSCGAPTPGWATRW